MLFPDFVEVILGTLRVEQDDGTKKVLDRISIPIVAFVYRYAVLAVWHEGDCFLGHLKTTPR